MFNYINDEAFVKSVLKEGCIPFVVRGSLRCPDRFEFPHVGVLVSGPTLHLEVTAGRSEGDASNRVLVRELVEEGVFRGQIQLPERTEEGICKALYALELWADFLCLAVGNPKLQVEVQRPVTAVIASRDRLDHASLVRWARLMQCHFQLGTNERSRVAAALWWYRKGCAAAYYSVFDSYTAHWNSLETLCGVSGGKIRKGPEVDGAVQDYLQNKKRIKSGHILECYNRFVKYGIARQMRDALRDMVSEKFAEDLTYQCFEVKPEKERLYQIRNDINHGNIRENSAADYERAYLRGQLLSAVVMMLLCGKLGHPVFAGGIDELAQQLSRPPWRADDSASI